MTRIAIDIVSDTICPWCFVGKRKLERAIATFLQSPACPSPKPTFDITWHPFYLGPPTGPIQNKLQRYEQKFGKERVAQIVPHMKQVGEQVGIKFDYGGPVGPTYLSHRLLQYVQEKEPTKTDATVNAVFKAYFENQGNIFETEPLLKVVEEAQVGLDLKAAEAFLADPQGRSIIDAQVMEAQRKEIHGVPDFTINGRFNLNGAQESGNFVYFFNKLCKQQQESL